MTRTKSETRWTAFVLAALMLLLLILLVPYIRHHYILENGTQTLYRYYDSLEKDRTSDKINPFVQ